ncbi:MAG TPA: hypothetical protein PLO78_08820 [Candidatus Omnitrophota bacterium]|nr:hypothetical protein [Candidatus Omnitrophota bacterium]
MAYSKSGTLSELGKAFKRQASLDQSECVNWKGRTKDTHEYYSEIIANGIVSGRNINRIGAMKRRKSYNLKSVPGEDVFYLSRLKKSCNQHDTLLKAVLEVQNGLQCAGDKQTFLGALFLSTESLAAKEALRLNEMPSLRKLIKFLKVKIFIFDSNEVII